jgi:hypothetical protein
MLLVELYPQPGAVLLVRSRDVLCQVGKGEVAILVSSIWPS